MCCEPQSTWGEVEEEGEEENFQSFFRDNRKFAEKYMMGRLVGDAHSSGDKAVVWKGRLEEEDGAKEMLQDLTEVGLWAAVFHKGKGDQWEWLVWMK